MRGRTSSVIAVLSVLGALVASSAVPAQRVVRVDRNEPALPEQTDSELEAQAEFLSQAKAENYSRAEEILKQLRAATDASKPLNIRVDTGVFYGSLQNDKAVPILMRLLDSVDPRTREPAVRILGYRQVRQAGEKVLALLDDADPQVRAAAASTLGRLEVRAALPKIKAMLESTDWNEVYSAADALAAFGDPALLGALIARYRTADVNIRSSLLYAIGRFKTEEAKELLLEVVRSGEPQEVSNAVWPLAMYETDHERIVTVLLERLKSVGELAEDSSRGMDEESSVAMSIVGVLGRFKDPRAYDALLALLDSKNEYIAGQAAGALGQQGDARAAPALIAALGKAKGQARFQILQGLGMLGTDEALDVLLKELKTADANMRNTILYSISYSENPRVVPVLMEALDDTDTGVCQSACRALGRLRVKEAVPRLIELLKHEDQWVRQSAAMALGDVGDRSALEPLAAASRAETDPLIEEWMVNAISAISRFREPVTLDERLEQLGRDHKVLWHTADTGDPQLEWIALENEFVVFYERKLYTLTDFRDALDKAGLGGVTANAIGFAADRVWIGTTHGLFAYTRMTRAVEQYAVAMRYVDANVSKVSVGEDAVEVTLDLGGESKRFRYDPQTDVWSAAD